jgi:hypothetical protein
MRVIHVIVFEWPPVVGVKTVGISRIGAVRTHERGSNKARLRDSFSPDSKKARGHHFHRFPVDLELD